MRRLRTYDAPRHSKGRTSDYRLAGVLSALPKQQRDEQQALNRLSLESTQRGHTTSHRQRSWRQQQLCDGRQRRGG